MAESKYGKYFLSQPRLRDYQTPPQVVAPKAVLQSGAHFGSGNFSMCWECITEPFIMDPVAHSHDFDEYLAFMGSNAENVFDFDAEVEVYMGEEGEKHVIDKATVLYIPAGLVHCPVVYKRIGKPILFDVIAFAPAYYDSTESKKYYVRKGERDKVIDAINLEIHTIKNAPTYTDSLKTFLKELEDNQDIN